jgi:succinate dehydrogenase / fumarate reductase cytochrome b subunit
VLFYLFMHVVETSTVLFGPEVYNAAVGIFKNLPARLGEVLLMAAVVYHALNGIRVIAMDFWPGLTVYYRPLTYGVIVATVVSMIPLGLIMIRPFVSWGG